MAKFLKVAAVAAAGFFRLGRHWPQAGELVPVTDLTEADIERLTNETMLRVTEVDGPEPEISDDELKAMLKGAIAALPEDGFQKDGKPKLTDLQAALPEQKARITASLRDEVWAEVNPPSA